MTSILRTLLAILSSLTPFFAPAAAEDFRVWTDLKGRTVEGAVTACDFLWFTIVNEEGKKGAIQIDQLSETDRAYLTTWREENPNAPWIDPEKPPPWPRKLGDGIAEIELIGQEPNSQFFVYRSANFELRSDVKLPMSFAREVASIFESTRTAIRSLPLGLGAKPAPRGRRARSLREGSERLLVQLFKSPNDYARAGGPPGTSGSYHSWLGRTLISLENVGQLDDRGELDLDTLKHEYVLRHEITHQIMHDWLAYLPMWLREGIAEYFGAVGYENGFFTFDELDLRMQAYLNKWRFNEDPNKIPMLHPNAVLTMTEQEWQQSLRFETPILNYNSAALLTYFFLHHDGELPGAPLAAYFDAVRRGVSTAEATQKHLMRGRSPEQLKSAIVSSWRNFNVAIEITEGP